MGTCCGSMRCLVPCLLVGACVVAVASYNQRQFEGTKVPEQVSQATLTIHWQRLIDDRGQTCDRCGATEQAVQEAYELLRASLAPLGMTVELKKTALDPETFKKNPAESNRLFIGGTTIEELLDARVAASPCCGSCGDVECRTLVVDGQTHEAIPARLIVRAGLIAASRRMADSSTCCCQRGQSPVVTPSTSTLVNAEDRMRNTIVVGLTLGLMGLSPLSAEPAVPASPGQVALDAAAKDQKYLFILFHKQDDEATRAMRQSLKDAVAKQDGKPNVVEVKTSDAAEKPLIDRWNLSRSPMPMVLAIAPNGAVTGGFPLKLTEANVAGAIVSPTAATVLKATQAKKLVLLVVQPEGGKGVPAGVQAFRDDEQYGANTEIVAVRADDKAEAAFLKSLDVKLDTTAVTVFLAPPGTMLGKFDANVTKDALVAKLKSAQGGCCPDGKCCPGGCCPDGKCEPKK